MSDLVAADQNMQAAWGAFVGVGMAPSVRELDGASLHASGVPVPLFNPAYVNIAPADPDDLVATIVDHYAGLGTPFALYFRDEVATGLADACARAGLVEHFQMPLMVMDPITAPPFPPDGVEIAMVDASNVDGMHRALADGYGMPIELSEVAFPSAVLALEPFIAVLATVDGEPAAVAGCYRTDDIAGVYAVATVPEHRNRGLGAAVTWAAVEIGTSTGARWSVLQASPMGAPVYERMGFVTRDHYRQFERPS
jgi:GNAT superfamily N-acetyltransferase